MFSAMGHLWALISLFAACRSASKETPGPENCEGAKAYPLMGKLPAVSLAIKTVQKGGVAPASYKATVAEGMTPAELDASMTPAELDALALMDGSRAAAPML